jgi:tetratricopeptide (TPR) repeat protein
MTANTGTTSGSSSGSSSGSWLSAHGRLWYDDRWYRIAWIVWPQAIGLLLFVSLWLAPSGGPSFIPWAKPIVEAPKNPPAAPVLPAKPKEAAPPPLAEPPADVLAPCKSGDSGDIIQACTSLLASGNLRGSNIAYAYWYRGAAYYATKQYQPAMNDFDRAITMFPRASEFYNDRGVLWMALGNNDRAMQDFDQAILLKDDYALAYSNRGIALRNLNRPNEALVCPVGGHRTRSEAVVGLREPRVHL